MMKQIKLKEGEMIVVDDFLLVREGKFLKVILTDKLDSNIVVLPTTSTSVKLLRVNDLFDK